MQTRCERPAADAEFTKHIKSSTMEQNTTQVHMTERLVVTLNPDAAA